MELVLEAPTLGEAWGRGGRPAEPVRRHSRLRGRFEGMFWRPFRPKDVARFLTCQIEGMRLLGKVGATEQEMAAVVEAAMRSLG